MNKLLLVCLLVLAPVSLASADLKIAVIDLGKAFDQYYKTKDASGRLQEKYSSFQKDMQGLVTDYQHMSDEAQKLQDSAKDPTLSQAARDDKAKALDTKKQDLLNLQTKIQEMRTERGREFDDEKFRLHQEIVGEISKTISDYSGPQGFDLVLDKSSASAASGVSIVLYNSSKLVDITDPVIKLLNQSAPPPGAAVPSGAASIPPAPAGP
jgi:outer membrane protein